MKLFINTIYKLISNLCICILLDMCLRELNGLARYNIIQMNEGYDVIATEEGQLMARFYLAFDTMKLFMQVKKDFYFSFSISVLTCI